MKLIYCPECLDVKKVRMLKVRHCACGKSWGYYLDDDLTAVVGGLAVPLAIENDKLREAAARRPKNGRGSFCRVRVLPEEYDTLRHRSEPDPAIAHDGGAVARSESCGLKQNDS
jgi:hypothetical protein